MSKLNLIAVQSKNELLQYRNRVNRPLSKNPFSEATTTESSENNQTNDQEQLPEMEYSGSSGQTIALDNGTEKAKTDQFKAEDTSGTKNVSKTDEDEDDAVPHWINLLFDLSWTATFSNLTNNAQFKEPWDTVSYIAFFITAWWLWVSYVFYSVEFATNDWFHLVVVFLQLVLFGALASATQGLDVTSYILHSPGLDTLDIPYTITDETTPDRYKAERLTSISFRVIMISIFISRVLLLIRHSRLIYYANKTPKSGKFPHQLWIVPGSLIVSGALFLGAFLIDIAPFGHEPHGAKIKFILWGTALLVEMIAQLVRAELSVESSQSVNGRTLVPSTASISDRLQDITVIILGEGVNAISGSFYALLQAPGFRSASNGISITCCAVIVFLLAYLYFTGPGPLKPSPKSSRGSDKEERWLKRRRAGWVMMHLPWLLSVILLLEGVKNQLILTNFIDFEIYLLKSLAKSTSGGIDNPNELGKQMQPVLLSAGMTWPDQWKEFTNMRDYSVLHSPNWKTNSSDVISVWFFRMTLNGSINMFSNFMEDDGIDESTQSTIDRYLTNFTYTLEDVRNIQPPHFANWHLYEIINKLMEPSLNNGRYIMAICGITFLSLASLNLIQSWPRDRYQWASIFSRYAMGLAMVFLLLLNIGKSQVYTDATVRRSDRAGVLRWIAAHWAIPTLALAYVIQFIIDTALIWFAVRHIRRIASNSQPHDSPENKRET